MEKDKAKLPFSDCLDVTIDTSVVDVNPDDSVNYQTADEENSSKYFSVVEDESTLENVSNSDMSLQIDKSAIEPSEITGTESSVDQPYETDLKSLNIIDSLSNMDTESVSKYNIHETVETNNILHPSMDIFDDNESSVDGHELIIDDDPHPERSDDCMESSTEISTDMQYIEDTSESTNSTKILGFNLLKKDSNSDDIPELTLQETKSSCNDENDIDDSPKQIVNVKIFTDDSGDAEMKSESYNFPEGSHRVTLVMDGNNVEAINIGQNIYIYTNSNGELTAFQLFIVNGQQIIKHLHVGKNEDGNIEVYEEQVNQVTVTPDNVDSSKEKELSNNMLNADTKKPELKSSTEVDKISQDSIKAVINQGKISIDLNHKDHLVCNENKVSTLSDKETTRKINQYKNCKVMLNEKLKSNENDSDFSHNLSNVEYEKISIDSPTKKLIANNENKNALKNYIIDSQLYSKENLQKAINEITSMKNDTTESSPKKSSNFNIKDSATIEKVTFSDKDSNLEKVSHVPIQISDKIVNDININISKRTENSNNVLKCAEKIKNSHQSVDYNENEKKTDDSVIDKTSLISSIELDNKCQETKIDSLGSLNIEKNESKSTGDTFIIKNVTLGNNSVLSPMKNVIAETDKWIENKNSGIDTSCLKSEICKNKPVFDLNESKTKEKTSIDIQKSSNDNIHGKSDKTISLSSINAEENKVDLKPQVINTDINKESALSSDQKIDTSLTIKEHLITEFKVLTSASTDNIPNVEKDNHTSSKDEKILDTKSANQSEIDKNILSQINEENTTVDISKSEKVYLISQNKKAIDKCENQEVFDKIPPISSATVKPCEVKQDKEVSLNLENDEKSEDLSISNITNLSKSDSQNVLESDDDFEEEFVEGEPVTGDSGADWNDTNSISNVSKLNSNIKETSSEENRLPAIVESSESIMPKKLLDSLNVLPVESQISPKILTENKFHNFEDKKEQILVIDSSDSPSLLRNVAFLENAKDDDLVNAEEIDNILNDSCSNDTNEIDENTVTLHIVDASATGDDIDDLAAPFVTKQVILNYGKSEEYIPKDREPDESNDSFEIFHHKTGLKTYSRELKSNLASPNKKMASISLGASDVVVNDEVIIKSNINELDHSENKMGKVTTPSKLTRNVLEESQTPDISPKQKSRQPRKQVFTSVAKSDIEIIFSGSEDIKEHDISKTTKTYSRAKHKDTNIEKLKPKSKNEDKKVILSSLKSENKKENVSIITPTKIENKKETNIITSSNEKSTKILPEPSMNEIAKTPTKEEDLKKVTDDPVTPNQKTDENINISCSPLSNSAKRKRGRPKKIESPITNVFESVILNVDGSLRKPLEKSLSNLKDLPEKELEVKSKDENSSGIDVSKNYIGNNKKGEENVLGIDETGKRKKGRPKKLMSLSFNASKNVERTDLKRKSLSDLDYKKSNSFDKRNDSLGSENICPICSKNFRSPTVLLKHAKHCNGVINLEAFKSPKRKKVESKSETADISKIDDILSTPEHKNINLELSLHAPDSISEEVNKSVNSINDTDVTAITISSVEDKSVLELDDSTVYDGKLVNKTTKSITETDDDKPIETDNKTNLIAVNSSCNKNCEVEPNIVSDTHLSLDKNSEIELEKHSNMKISPNKNVNDADFSLKDKKSNTKPLKGKSLKKIDATTKLSPMSRLSKFLNTKPPTNKTIKCETCNKTFRQLAHMVYHRNKHEEEKSNNRPIVDNPVQKSNDQAVQKNECDAILKCEICKKGFRKLHHLVEHREVHANTEIKSRRASTVSVKSEPEAGFRCEACDKSFRKLHHLVAHRELHLTEANEAAEKPPSDVKSEKELEKDDATCTGCGKSFRKRHHMVEHRDTHCSPKKKRHSEDSEMSENNVRLSITSSTSDETNNCNICGKSYRKFHHMIEHRESHVDSVVKSEHRVSTRFSSPDSLNTKDIIHECSKCYMVFPNVNSLNKHTENCTRKKIINKKPVFTESLKTNKNSNKTVNSEANKMKSLKIDEKPSSSKIIKPKSTKKPEPGTGIVKSNSKTKPILKSENEVKYKINPAFKKKLEFNKLSDNSKPKPKSNDSVLSGLRVPSARILKTIIEETTVKYSFPKSSKQVEKPKIASKLPLRKSVVPKQPIKSTLTIRRRSLGAGRSVEVKKINRESIAKSKPQRKTTSSLADVNRSIKFTKDSCKCDCGKVFENETLLKKHMDTEHTPPKSYKCLECGISVRTAIQFSKHKRTHEDSNAGQSSQARKNKSAARLIASSVKKNPVTPRRDVKKSKVAHRGVPLTEKMKKAIAGSKF